jgi:hypothetical protein
MILNCDICSAVLETEHAKQSCAHFMQRMQERPSCSMVITYHFFLVRMHGTQKEIRNAVMCKDTVKAIYDLLKPVPKHYIQYSLTDTTENNFIKGIHKYKRYSNVTIFNIPKNPHKSSPRLSEGKCNKLSMAFVRIHCNYKKPRHGQLLNTMYMETA